jgi:hypothetical protein
LRGPARYVAAPGRNCLIQHRLSSFPFPSLGCCAKARACNVRHLAAGLWRS